ncbi:DUF4214 domain-containing protein [Halarcobacter sp.]|uniref:DUF4214 domain-containing protein n=1 Tax=Halarcobacter sp. TaxID=2321133 RepID=UPI002AA70E45|nr:DUF4214 domain-containing protein [Halarcobacter sp.]
MKKIIIMFLMILTVNTEIFAEQTAEQFIERLYQNVLNRASDNDGLSYWLERLQSESGANVASGFLNSQELENMNLSNSEYLEILYSTLFDREADQNGILYWLNIMDNGMSRERIQQGFYNSQEFSNLADSFGITAIREQDQLEDVEDFVTRFYNLVLGRNPDAAGLIDWINQLNSGIRSGADVANGFFNSPEFVNRNLSNENFVNILYNTFFNRSPDTAGYQNWVDQLNNGETRQNIIDGFSNSQEFENLANEYGISATLETGNLLGNVQDYENRTPLSNINISLYDTNSNLVDSTTTDTNGFYYFQNLRGGNYTINFSSDDYLDAIGNFDILPNTNNVFSQVLMPENNAQFSQGSISGYIIDAFSGNNLTNVFITVYSGLNTTEGTPIRTISSYDGYYTLDGLEAGYYTITLSKDNYLSSSYSFTIGGNNQIQERDFTISPILAHNEIRIILTWGASPYDLDSHTAYLENGQRIYHNYYSNKEEGNQNNNYITLDRDDMSSYGPETTTVTNMSLNGQYKYYVHDYSNRYSNDSTFLANSGASVKVYFGNRSYTFNVPTYRGNTWKVFEINNGILSQCNNSNCVFNTSTNGSSIEFGARSLVKHDTITSEEFLLFENLPLK